MGIAIAVIAILSGAIALRWHGSGRRFCGVKLSQDAEALLTDVERRYGKKVREEVANGLPKELLANSGVDQFDNPFVRINAAMPADESTVVHELFHLKLLTEGYPYRIVWDLSALGDDDGVRYEVLKRELFMGILDPLSHRIFYPQMRAMHLGPNDHQKRVLEDVLDQYRDQRANWTPERAILAYFSFGLELADNPDLLQQLDAWYVKQGWPAELATARAMVGSEQNAEIGTPERLVAEFVRCANLFLQRRATVEFRGWMPVSGPPDLVAAAFSVIPASEQSTAGGGVHE